MIFKPSIASRKYQVLIKPRQLGCEIEVVQSSVMPSREHVDTGQADRRTVKLVRYNPPLRGFPQLTSVLLQQCLTLAYVIAATPHQPYSSQIHITSHI